MTTGANPPAKKPNYGCGCLVFVLAVIALAAIFGGGTGSGGSNAPEQHQMTKAEWMQKAATVGKNVAYGQIITSANALYQAVGQPTSTQFVGEDAYLYWDCADGQIQVVTQANFLRYQGMIAGQINSY